MDVEKTTNEFYVCFTVSAYEFYHVVLWLVNNNINFRHIGSSYEQIDKMVPYVDKNTLTRWDHYLWFKNEEDLVAFKLRWL